MSFTRRQSEDAYRLDKHAVRVAFERVAPHYDVVARLEPEVARRLLEHLDPVRLSPVRVLDLGAGTGAGARRLQRRYPGVPLIALDFALAMLKSRRSKRRFWHSPPRAVCGDLEALPLASGCVDLVHSNLVLPWCNSLRNVFRGCLRVLAPGGLFAFSTFGPDTLKELRASWMAADAHVHVHRFTDMHDIGDALVSCGFTDVVMDAERLVVTYADADTLMRDLKAAGAQNAAAGRARGLTGSACIARVRGGYEQFRRDGALPATFELVYGHAWKPRGGSVEVPDDSLRATIAQRHPPAA